MRFCLRNKKALNAVRQVSDPLHWNRPARGSRRYPFVKRDKHQRQNFYWSHYLQDATFNRGLDTGAELNFIQEEYLEANWRKFTQTSNWPGLKNAANQKNNVVGAILLRVKMGDTRVRVDFNVVSHFAVPVLLGASFINRFVTNIFCPGRSIVRYNSRPIPMIAIRDLLEDLKEKDDKA